MGGNREVEMEGKWDTCLDIALRRSIYSSVAGAFGAFLFFRSPATRWASVAFGAGVGIGSAYTECSNMFNGSSAKFSPPKIDSTPKVIQY